MEEAKQRVQMAAPKSEASGDTTAQDFDMQVFISTGMPDGRAEAPLQAGLGG